MALLGGGYDEELYSAADGALRENVGDGVFLRGLVELSNICRKNCSYCGLRRDNRSVRRYTIPFDEVVSVIGHGYSRGLRSFLLQSGELPDARHLDLVERILRWTATELGDVRMVLSMGELSPDVLDRLRRAGAHRYLLRIESSSPEYYSRFHPSDGMHLHAERINALAALRDSGWQTGSGVLIGLPGQTMDHLADDLLFLREFDIDMCGMGPYLAHRETPLWEERDSIIPAEDRIDLTLRMISLLRLMMPTVNMAATTALQTLDPRGLEKGLSAGANVVMPNLTPETYRKDYDLYQGKTLVNDSLDDLLEGLSARCTAIGRRIALGSPGDPKHYALRMSASGRSSGEVKHG